MSKSDNSQGPTPHNSASGEIIWMQTRTELKGTTQKEENFWHQWIFEDTIKGAEVAIIEQ